jgi:hypothetical protein
MASRINPASSLFDLAAFLAKLHSKKMDSKRDHHRLLHQTSLAFLVGHQVYLPSTNIDAIFREQGVHKH